MTEGVTEIEEADKYWAYLKGQWENVKTVFRGAPTEVQAIALMRSASPRKFWEDKMKRVTLEAKSAIEREKKDIVAHLLAEQRSLKRAQDEIGVRGEMIEKRIADVEQAFRNMETAMKEKGEDWWKEVMSDG